MDMTVDQVYADFDDKLRRFVRKHIADAHAAEDVLQETYLRIHARLHTLREAGRLQSWVYQIARNAIIDYYRRQRPADELPEDLAQAEAADQDEAGRQLAASIKTMVNCLPEKYRQALVLTEFQGLTQQDLAERLGLSLSGAKSRVQRAREKLKDTLLDCCHVELDRLGRVVDYAPRCAACARDDYLDDCAPDASPAEANLDACPPDSGCSN